jgi:ribose transport system permease protein
VSAIVLGGVSLAGGRGGMLGPIAAAYILALIPADLIYLGIDPNYGQMIQGVLIVLVVMAGGLGMLLRRR